MVWVRFFDEGLVLRVKHLYIYDNCFIKFLGLLLRVTVKCYGLEFKCSEYISSNSIKGKCLFSGMYLQLR